MSSMIPSYGDYERKGSGGPEGKCLMCKYEGPMYHAPTGYECEKCHATQIHLKLKNGEWYDNGTRQRLAAGPPA